MPAGNLLVDEDFNVRVADFGLSRVTHDLNTLTGGQGTFQYMAPEVMANQRYSVKADVYSFGMVLWECTARQVRQLARLLTPDCSDSIYLEREHAACQARLVPLCLHMNRCSWAISDTIFQITSLCAGAICWAERHSGSSSSHAQGPKARHTFAYTRSPGTAHPGVLATPACSSPRLCRDCAAPGNHAEQLWRLEGSRGTSLKMTLGSSMCWVLHRHTELGRCLNIAQ